MILNQYYRSEDYERIIHLPSIGYFAFEYFYDDYFYGNCEFFTAIDGLEEVKSKMEANPSDLVNYYLALGGKITDLYDDVIYSNGKGDFLLPYDFDFGHLIASQNPLDSYAYVIRFITMIPELSKWKPVMPSNYPEYQIFRELRKSSWNIHELTDSEYYIFPWNESKEPIKLFYNGSIYSTKEIKHKGVNRFEVLSEGIWYFIEDDTDTLLMKMGDKVGYFDNRKNILKVTTESKKEGRYCVPCQL